MRTPTRSPDDRGRGRPGSSLPLFDDATIGPDGFRYTPALVTSTEAMDLVKRFEGLPFAPFAFQGFTGNRHTVAYGSRYDVTHSGVIPAAGLPDWLRPLRTQAARFAEVEAADLVQALITRYPPGAGIGWHRDRPEYGRIVGVSFESACSLRLRRRDGAGWRRMTVPLEPRSAYLLDGEAREAWQHSITPGEELRYSVTFRTAR